MTRRQAGACRAARPRAGLDSRRCRRRPKRRRTPAMPCSTARSISSTSISSRRRRCRSSTRRRRWRSARCPTSRTPRRRVVGDAVAFDPRQPARLPYRALHARPGRLLRTGRRLPLRAPPRHAPAVPAARRGDLCRHRHRQRRRSTASASSPTSMTAVRRRSAGLMAGDEIVSVDGAPFAEIGSFRGKAGETAHLMVRRTADAAADRHRRAGRRDPAGRPLRQGDLGQRQALRPGRPAHRLHPPVGLYARRGDPASSTTSSARGGSRTSTGWCSTSGANGAGRRAMRPRPSSAAPPTW